jgi:hypothetical protein
MSTAPAQNGQSPSFSYTVLARISRTSPTNESSPKSTSLRLVILPVASMIADTPLFVARTR